MENASKALLIAGGILVALLIIGGLLLMFNTIGDYQRAQDSNKKTSQIAEFNMDFERYADDKGIKGADIVSLINKVIDYNKKSGIDNSVDYSIKMTLTVSGLDKFNRKYAYDKLNDTNSLFNQDSFSFGTNNDNNSLRSILKNFTANEGTLGIEKLKVLSSVYNVDLNKEDNVNKIREKLKEFYPNGEYKTWNGSSAPTLDTIKKYRQYSEFKSSTFKIDQSQEGGGVVYNEKNGQIQKLYFKFVK